MAELENIVRAAASDIVNQAIWENYKFYLLVAAISLLSTGIGVFFASYLKRRGENLATKADFDEILRQLKETTILAEGIRSEIKVTHEEKHNIRAILREKMEALFAQTFELELWLERRRAEAFDGKLLDINASPFVKIEMYQAIYFKDLRGEILVLRLANSAVMSSLLDLGLAAFKANAESKPLAYDMKEFKKLQPPLLVALSAFRDKLLEKYAEKLGL